MELQNVVEHKPNVSSNTENDGKFYSTLELKHEWDSLCSIKGCLAGGQRIHDGKWGGETIGF